MTNQKVRIWPFRFPSLRGARFLAYASEQAPQSWWGQEIAAHLAGARNDSGVEVLAMAKDIVLRFSPGQLQKFPKLDEKSNGLPNTEEVKEEWLRS